MRARSRIDRLELLDAVLAAEQALEEARGRWQESKRIIERRARILRVQYRVAARFLATDH